MITVGGAAAVRDTIHRVERLPAHGDTVSISQPSDDGPIYNGGSAPNIACSLARLGEQVELIYPVGEDFMGSGAERAWREAGLNLDGIVTVPGTKSGYAYLFFEENGDTMCCAYPGAASVAPPPLADPHDLVVVAPVFGKFTQPLLQIALHRGLRVVVSGIAAAGLVPYLPNLYALVINSGEADALCRHLGKSSHDAVAAEFPHLLLYITHGRHGSCLHFESRREQVSRVPAAAFVDPTGAGDSYTAGVVAALLKGFDPVTAGIVGAINASYVVEAFGAQTNLPTWSQIVARARQMGIERLDTNGSNKHE